MTNDLDTQRQETGRDLCPTCNEPHPCPRRHQRHADGVLPRRIPGAAPSIAARSLAR